MEKKQKELIGRIVSDKMDKTVVVQVETLKHHPLYKKTVRKLAKYKAHNENNEGKTGDLVKIVESRPLSREKRWRIVQIIKKEEVPEVKPTEI